MSDFETWAKRPEPHTTPETMGTRCDNCEHLACIEQKGAKVHKWAYYCELLHKRFTFKELYAITKKECPEHRDLRRRRFTC